MAAVNSPVRRSSASRSPIRPRLWPAALARLLQDLVERQARRPPSVREHRCEALPEGVNALGLDPGAQFLLFLLGQAAGKHADYPEEALDSDCVYFRGWQVIPSCGEVRP